MPDRFKSEFKTAYGDITSDFNKALPKRPAPLNIVPKRLELDGKYVELGNKTVEAGHLYGVVIAALYSEWFKGITERSQKSYTIALITFLSWLNEEVIDFENRYTLLKDYEAWRVDVSNVKPQSTGLDKIIVLLNNGINYEPKYQAVTYIKNLLKNTEISKADERKQNTLTGYFSSMPWLRELLGEKDYLKMESPKILMASFSVVVAATLLFIVEQKKIARKKIANPYELIKINGVSKRDKDNAYCSKLLMTYGEFNEELEPANALTELMLADFVPTEHRDKLKRKLSKHYSNSKIRLRRSDGNRDYLTIEPSIFRSETWYSHSEIEQYLCTWLCAWQTVQPTDVGRLKRNNFVINKNEYGKPVAIQCTYYKSRSQRMQEPPMLSANQIEGKALIAYLEELPENDSLLFTNEGLKRQRLTFSPSTIPARLNRILQLPIVNRFIDQNLELAESSSLFLRIYSAVALNGVEPYNLWSHRQNAEGNIALIEKYRELVKRPMPDLLFGLAAIKNSSIHARTDRYRDGDLVNLNSHSSLTEKISYLTDSNKEWVNQNGRITRLVMKDIQGYVYRPNLDVAIYTAYEKVLRTRVIDVLAEGVSGQAVVKVNAIGQIDKKKSAIQITEIDYADILVLNSTETVVTMLHYINEAERQYSNLVNNALDFFEKTVLVNVEWMERILKEGYLTVHVVKEGQLIYDEIKNNLPKLFVNELRGAVGV